MKAGRNVGAVALGVMSALVGLAPWLLTGARLPLQNLWGTESGTADMPFALVPFSQYYVVSVAGMFIVGAAIAGLAAAFTMRDRRWWVLLGVAGMQLIALVQASVVTLLGLRGDDASQLYFGVIAALLALSLLVAAGVCALCVVPGRAGWASPARLVGVALAAVFVGSWLVLLADAVIGDVTAIMPVARWISPVLIGIAIVCTGVHTWGRLIAAIGSLLVLWVGPAAVTAVASVLGSRAILREPDEAIVMVGAYLRAALTTPDVVVGPLVVAAGIGVAGLAARYVIGRR